MHSQRGIDREAGHRSELWLSVRHVWVLFWWRSFFAGSQLPSLRIGFIQQPKKQYLEVLNEIYFSVLWGRQQYTNVFKIYIIVFSKLYWTRYHWHVRVRTEWTGPGVALSLAVGSARAMWRKDRRSRQRVSGVRGGFVPGGLTCWKLQRLNILFGQDIYDTIVFILVIIDCSVSSMIGICTAAVYVWLFFYS